MWFAIPPEMKLSIKEKIDCSKGEFEGSGQSSCKSEIAFAGTKEVVNICMTIWLYTSYQAADIGIRMGN